LNELLNDAGAVARAAGREILRYYRTGAPVKRKADRSPVTDADLAAHELICRELARLTPGLPVLSEESEPAALAERRTWRRFWMVDPLDGTREFIRNQGLFTVNIAFIENGDCTLGIVHAPVLEITYAAARGEGAFRRRGDASPVAIRARKAEPDRLGMVVRGSRLGRRAQAVLTRTAGVARVQTGDDLKFGVVAAGQADFYVKFGPTCEWDTAAAQCIMEGAGGTIVGPDGRPLRYNKEVLDNPAFACVGDTSLDWRQILFEGLS
jgi:3'(2'), 5'-bisphosphate nucleotidase